MPSTIQVGGPVGPFVDPATGQQVGAKAWGTCTFDVAPGADPAAAQARVGPQLLQAVTQVLHQKIATGQVPVAQLQAALPHFFGEIVGASGLQGQGVYVQNVALQLAMGGAAGPAPGPAAPASDDPQFRYQVNIGGLRIKGTSDGGVDSKGLQNQLVDKAKSAVIWWVATAVVVLVVILGLGGLGFYIYAQAKSGGAGGVAAAGGAPKDATWDGKSTFTCGGNDVVKLKGVTAKLASGEAIEAGGNCVLVLEGVQITAPVGISAGGNATVTMTGGSIDASEASVKALGNAKVTLAGTKVKGKTQALGAGKITGP